jgi:ABC-type multidrug transport system ATPase subunit
MDPRTSEAEVKTRLAYVPDFVAFYPWMSVREALDYQTNFRGHWNRDVEGSLLRQLSIY